MVPFSFSKSTSRANARGHKLATVRASFRDFFMLALFTSLTAGSVACTSQKDMTVIRMTGGQQFRFKNSETLRVPLETEPPTIDWNKVSDTTSANVCGNIMDLSTSI